MAQQTMTGRAAVAGASAGVAPEAGIRIAGVLLALAVAAAHVADKGGVTAFTSPDWIGWGYRLIEVGGVLTALAMLLPWRAGLGRPWLRWAAAVLVGARMLPALRHTTVTRMVTDHDHDGHVIGAHEEPAKPDTKDKPVPAR